MEDEENSWIRRTKFSHTIYHRFGSIRVPRIEALGVESPRLVSTIKREESSAPKSRRRSVDYPRSMHHSPGPVVQWNPLTNTHRSVSPTPESMVSDAFKEARLDLKRFSTPHPRGPDSDKGIMGKLFHRDHGDAKGHHGKHSPDHSPRGPLRTRRGSDKNLRKELAWSKMFDHGGRRVTAVEAADEHMADMSQLLIGHRFAHGAHSRLHHGIYKDEVVAVKIITVPDDDDSEPLGDLLQDQFNREVNFLSRLQHPNVIKFIAAWKKPPVYGIIGEYLSQGSLRTYLHKLENKTLPFQKTIEFSLEIAQGMEFVHSQGIIHRDLKPENILIDQDFHMKVGDFGSACEETHVDHFESDRGTFRWMAPEMIKHKHYGRKVDVYSFGIILWEMIAGSTPYEGMNPVQAAFAVVAKNMRPEFPMDCPPALRTLIEHCWSSHPEKRPEFSHIVKVLNLFKSSLAHDGALPSVLDPTWIDDYKRIHFLRIHKHDQLLNSSPMPKPRFS